MKTKHFIQGIFLLFLAIGSVSLYFTIQTINQQKENQRIDLTSQIENLEKGDSLVISNLVYPSIFKSLDRQFEHSSDLMFGKRTLVVGLNGYNCRSYRATSPGGVLKEFSFDTDDHLYHYRVFVFRDSYLSTNHADYSTQIMTIIRL